MTSQVVCTVCLGAGGGFAVGQCSRCGQPACEEHFVGLPSQIPGAIWSGPRAEWRRRSRAYQSGWAAGEALCTSCRASAGEDAQRAFDDRRRTLASTIASPQSGLNEAGRALQAMLSEYHDSAVLDLRACERWFRVLSETRRPPSKMTMVTPKVPDQVVQHGSDLVWPARGATEEVVAWNRDGDPLTSAITYFVEQDGTLWKAAGAPRRKKSWRMRPTRVVVTASAPAVKRERSSNVWWWVFSGVEEVIPVNEIDHERRARILARVVADATVS